MSNTHGEWLDRIRGRSGEGMTARERQLWYWRKEMESAHRRMQVYPQDSAEYRHWKERYESAVRTYEKLSGTTL